MFQHLDDPLPLPRSSPQDRQKVIDRGRSLQRRRRAAVAGVPLVAAVAVASTVWVSAGAPGSSGDETLTPAAPPPPLLSLEDSTLTPMPDGAACTDPVGDSAGEPDVTLFSLDRPSHPFVHYHWEAGGTLPPAGVVELRFEAASADGRRLRQLVARIVDGAVVEKFVRDPRTGARLDAPPEGEVDPDSGMGVGFPAGSLNGLGAGWTWVGSLSVDGAVVDSCDASVHQP